MATHPTRSRRDDRIAAVTALSDPVRRAVYDYVASRNALAPHTFVSRSEVGAALDLARSTAAFHLDRLADEGLLRVDYRRPEGRSGPGAGRPAKLYALADDEISVSIPGRRYELAGELLASTIETARETDSALAETLESCAHAAGRSHAGEGESLEDTLRASGYEPVDDGSGGYVFATCPFHRLSRRHPDTVCALNRAYLDGLIEEQHGAYTVCAAAHGTPCCARIRPSVDQQTP